MAQGGKTHGRIGVYHAVYFQDKESQMATVEGGKGGKQGSSGKLAQVKP